MEASTIDELQEAIRLHREGALNEAAARYEQLLHRDAGNADAHYYLAALWSQQGRLEDAVGRVQRALSHDPQHARSHRLLGTLLGRAGRQAEALASLDRAIACDPDFADAHGARGDLLVEMGRLSEAVESYNRALAWRPDSISDWCNRGAALDDLKRYEEAIESYRRVLALQPDFPEMHFNCGNAQVGLERYQDALASYEAALALRPHYADALSNRGNALRSLGRYDEALASINEALAIDPAHVSALINLSGVLTKLGRYDEALAACDRAVALKTDYPNALGARYEALLNMERFEEAVTVVDEYLTLKPDKPEASWNKSLMCLAQGRLAEGWDLYDFRWTGGKDQVRRGYWQRRWRGEPFDGNLLVWCEQGLGDQILHASMMPEVMERAPNAVLEIEPRLVPLFARSFPGLRLSPVSLTELYAGPVDAQVPLCSLGQLYRRSWDTFPRREQGYLTADPPRACALRERLAADGKKLIGLSWVSRNKDIGEPKTARLRDLEAVLRLENCRFVDLQYGDTQAERESVERELGVRIERLPDIDNTQDIDGLAALITACDVVVTVSNTTAHLAGALGRPTWVIVPFGNARIWYWFRGDIDSPWYPRVHIRHLRAGQVWADVAPAVAGEVREFLAGRDTA